MSAYSFDTFMPVSYGGGTLVTVFGIIAIVVTICAAIFLLPRKMRDQFPAGFRRFVDFLNFETGIARGVLKLTYLALSVYFVLFGFYAMFEASFIIGLILLLMPLFLRVAYELIFAVLDIAKNTRELNAKSGGQPAPQPPRAVVPVEKPANVCAKCGAVLKENALFCGTCGEPVSKDAT